MFKYGLLSIPLLIAVQLTAQEKISYTLTEGYGNQSKGEWHYFIEPSQNIEYSYTTTIDGYTSEKLVGQLMVFISQDDKLNQDDEMLFSLRDTVQYLESGKYQYKHQLLPGEYYLLSFFQTNDTSTFKPRSNIMAQQVKVYDLVFSLKDARYYDVEISEYNKKRSIRLNMDVNATCCTQLNEYYDATFTVYVSPKPQITERSEQLWTFYEDITLDKESITIDLEAELYNEASVSKHNYVIVVASGYFGNNYTQLSDKVLSIPLKVINSIQELNQSKADQYPFLTYDDFEITFEDLEGLEVNNLISQTALFYNHVAKALAAGTDRDFRTYLSHSDSAFALAGRYKEATLFYANTSLLSGLYVSLIYLLEQENSFEEPYTREALNFRLEAAMDMEDLVENSYEKLSQSLIPEGISIASAVEETGYYGKDTLFNIPFLTKNPILWKDASLAVLAHYLRILDLEAADLMINNLDKHANLLIATWDNLYKFQMTTGEKYISGSLVDYNDMLDYHLLKLRFYGVTGQYQEGVSTFKQASLLYQVSEQFASNEFWKTAAEFFEIFGNYPKADSLYRLVDNYFEKRSSEYDDKALTAKLFLQTFHSDLLQAKLNPESIDETTINKYLKHYDTFAKKGFSLDVMEFLNQKGPAEMTGHFKNQSYLSLYKSNIERLKVQEQYIQTADWLNDLAFFVGRDGYYEAAFNIYNELFFYENIKMSIFRNAFSEEAQILYARQQHGLLSRYLNLLLEVPNDSISSEKKNKELVTAFEQVMSLHSFVLRSNYMLLDQVFKSEDDDVLKQFEIWKAYKQLLNQQLIEDNSQDSLIKILKKEINRTEKEIIRDTRDSSTLFVKESKSFSEIRNTLKPGEAAIEIIRINNNHKTYYGNGISYIAFMVTPNTDQPILISITDNGDDLESRRTSYYRSAIQYRLKDEQSYTSFWQPMADALPEGTSKIHLALDGVYHLINPATLLNPASEKYLFEEVGIELIPTLSMINENKQLEVETATLFGYPAFIEDPSPSVDSLATSRANLLTHEISSLPGTKVEVEKIEEILNSKNIKTNVYTGYDVNKSNIQSAEQRDLLHFATHGFWIEGKEDSQFASIYESLSQSGLILAKAQTRTSDGYKLESSGLLTAAEIQNMFLFGTKLVVLSACETGLGEIIPGEGIFGLKRAFQKAGTQYLVTSLWKVDDTATQQFMVYFYKSLTNGDVFEAYKDASLLLKKDYPQPHYWGAFTLIKFY